MHQVFQIGRKIRNWYYLHKLNKWNDRWDMLIQWIPIGVPYGLEKAEEKKKYYANKCAELGIK